ncbi:MAG: hypothetical protein BIFFINMI_03367 [Phycisphaerae bacterium]|nr:hypothetical protein [Phycisphaerae bacterium]
MSTHRRSIRAGWPMAALLLAAGLALVAWSLLPAPVQAEGMGVGTFKFVRLAEEKVGDREQIVIVVKPLEGDGEFKFYMGRQNKYLPVAKTLKEDQQITLNWGSEREMNWVNKITVAGADAPVAEVGPDAAGGELEKLTPEQLRARVKDLAAENAKLRARVKELEAQNARLREKAGEAPKVNNDNPTVEAAPLPDGAAGIRGLLAGTIQSKDGRVFTLKVTGVTKTFDRSTAAKPEALVGQTVTCVVAARNARLVHALNELNLGDAITVGVVNEHGNALQVVEDLSKDVPPAPIHEGEGH